MCGRLCNVSFYTQGHYFSMHIPQNGLCVSWALWGTLKGYNSHSTDAHFIVFLPGARARKKRKSLSPKATHVRRAYRQMV